MVNFSKFCSEGLHGDTNRRCVQMSKSLSDGKSVKSCAIRMPKNSAPSQTVAISRIAQKNLPGPVPNIWHTVFQISS